MLIGDTDDSNKIMADDEVTAALALSGDDVFTAAAICCRAIAASAAKSAIAWSAMGEFKVDKKQVPKYYLELADKYEDMAGLTDTTDYFVEWPQLIDKVSGRDDSDYIDDDDEEYYQNHFEDGDT